MCVLSGPILALPPDSTNPTWCVPIVYVLSFEWCSYLLVHLFVLDASESLDICQAQLTVLGVLSPAPFSYGPSLPTSKP